MKQFMKKFKNYLIISGLGLFIFQNSYAATLDDVVNAINGFRSSVENEVKNARVGLQVLLFGNNSDQSLDKFFYGINPSQPYATLGNPQQGKATETTVDSTDTKFTAVGVKKALLSRNDNEALFLGSMAATNTYFAPTAGFNITGDTSRQKAKFETIQAGDKSLNANTLLAPLVYNNFSFNQTALNKYNELLKNEKYEEAEPYLTDYINSLQNNPPYNFIELAGGLYQPVISPDIVSGINSITNPQKKMNVQLSPVYQQYQAAARAYIAAQSVGASNLYQMLVKRIAQSGVGKAAGMNKDNVSELELEQYLATRRSQNPQWYEQMAKAPPATVSRETLFVLAEIRDQLFELQQQNERMLATMSVMQLQSLQLSKTNLQLLQQSVAEKIRNEGGTVAGGAGAAGAMGGAGAAGIQLQGIGTGQ